MAAMCKSKHYKLFIAKEWIEVIRRDKIMLCISFTGSPIPPLRKQPLQKSYQYEITIRFNDLAKESVKEAPTAQIRVQRISVI